MGFSPGEESRADGVAAQAIEAQPVFGQIKPRRGQVLACAEQHPREKTWRMSVVLHKMSDSPGVEKETTAQKKDGASFRVPRADRAAAMDVLSACRGMRVARSALTTAAFALRRTTARQADPATERRRDACSSVPGRARQRHRLSPTVANASPENRRDEQRHARPGRPADQQRADPGEHLAPKKGWHADLRETQNSVIAGDPRRDGIEKPDGGA